MKLITVGQCWSDSLFNICTLYSHLVIRMISYRKLRKNNGILHNPMVQPFCIPSLSPAQVPTWIIFQWMFNVQHSYGSIGKMTNVFFRFWLPISLNLVYSKPQFIIENSIIWAFSLNGTATQQVELLFKML